MPLESSKIPAKNAQNTSENGKKARKICKKMPVKTEKKTTYPQTEIIAKALSETADVKTAETVAGVFSSNFKEESASFLRPAVRLTARSDAAVCAKKSILPIFAESKTKPPTVPMTNDAPALLQNGKRLSASSFFISPLATRSERICAPTGNPERKPSKSAEKPPADTPKIEKRREIGVFPSFSQTPDFTKILAQTENANKDGKTFSANKIADFRIISPVSIGYKTEYSIISADKKRSPKSDFCVCFCCIAATSRIFLRYHQFMQTDRISVILSKKFHFSVNERNAP